MAISGEKKRTSEQISTNLFTGPNILSSSLKVVHDVAIFDTMGKEIELCVSVNGNVITINSLVDISNVLVNIQGE